MSTKTRYWWCCKKRFQTKTKLNQANKDGTSSKAWKESHNDPIRVPISPVRISRMEKFKEGLNGMVQGVLKQAEA
ncbi:hypothetical protein LguiB_005371 [Lonicera macranthoides]